MPSAKHNQIMWSLAGQNQMIRNIILDIWNMWGFSALQFNCVFVWCITARTSGPLPPVYAFGSCLQTILVAPRTHPIQNRNQRLASFRQAVLDFGRYLRVFFPMYELIPLQFLQRRAQRLIGNGTDVLFYLIESNHAKLHKRIEDRHLIFSADQRQSIMEARCAEAWCVYYIHLFPIFALSFG